MFVFVIKKNFGTNSKDNLYSKLNGNDQNNFLQRYLVRKRVNNFLFGYSCHIHAKLNISI